jgi:Holliday junction resolvasome RuvABC endonuclease subunit
VILGLDISTSITGYTILRLDGKIAKIGHWDTRNKKYYPDLFSKVLFIKKEIEKISENYPIDHVFIEPALNMFMMGRTSSHTISTLTKYNGIVSWLCYEEFGIIPEYIPAISARKKCGITIKRGQKAKEQVMKFLIDNEPDFRVEFGRTGKPKIHCYDEADSLIIAKAGYECLKESSKL